MTMLYIIYALSASGFSGCNRLGQGNKHIDMLPPNKRLSRRHCLLQYIPNSSKLLWFFFLYEELFKTHGDSNNRQLLRNRQMH